MTFTQCICSFVDLREYGEERTWFLEKLKMMTILILRSFYYSGLSLWVSSFASVSFVLFPCLWFRRSRDNNDGGWLLLGFSCFCSFVPLLPSPYAAQFSFMSPSVSFYSPCPLLLPLCLVFLLGAGTCCLQLQTKMTVWKGCSNTASSPRFFFVLSTSFLHSASPFFFLPLCFSSLSSSPLCLVLVRLFLLLL